ncbi:MAG: DUF502 domain-containing protein [Pseudomonadota bacterium]
MEKINHTLPKRTLFAKLRGYFIAGILVSAPIYVTITIASWVIEFIDSTILPLVPTKYNPDLWLQLHLGFGLPGVGVIILIIALTTLGAVAAGFVGRAMIKLGENLLNNTPIIRSLYTGSKQIIQTILQDQSNAFKNAALIEYPRKDLWAIAFITNEAKGEIKEKFLNQSTPQEVIPVFLPTTPNPTSGFLLFVPKQDIILLDMAVEDAIKVVISAGIVLPPSQANTLIATDSKKCAA